VPEDEIHERRTIYIVAVSTAFDDLPAIFSHQIKI
jgi:hypothetical protein